MRRFSHVFVYGKSSDLLEGIRLTRYQGSTAWAPLVDIFERAHGIEVVVELPGVDKEQIGVTVERGVLTIRGFRPKHIPEDTQRVHQMEIPYGPFERSVELPFDADIDNIEAGYDEGHLTIRIPRKDSR